MGLDNGSRIQVPGQVPVRAAYTPTEAAFPVSVNATNGNQVTSLVFGGLTKREYAAVRMSEAILKSYDRFDLIEQPKSDLRQHFAQTAVALADAVLAAAREPQQPQPEQPNGI